jgi:hypothetical protein
LGSVIGITYTGVLHTASMRLRLAAVLLVWILVLTARAGQTEKKPEAEDALLLVQRASENEVASLENPVLCRYRERLQWSWGSETRAVIETSEGRVDRIIAFDDEPLAPDQAKRQERRLEKLLRDRNARKKELEEQRAEIRRRVRMMRAFPRALLFEAAGEGPDGLLRFAFRPNPKFSPSDRETQVFRGMQGTVWVDAKQQRLIKIHGVLTKNVSFGWGILGKLHKGGTYEIEQEQISPGVWRIKRLDLDLKGRAFLDGFRILRKETNKDFERKAEGETYQDAAEELLRSAVRAGRIPEFRPARRDMTAGAATCGVCNRSASPRRSRGPGRLLP